MSSQIIEFASEMKSQLKKIKNQYPNSTQWEHFYKHFKKLCSMIQQLSESKEKLPEFFQSLHTNTIDMRMKLLADLAKQESKRKRIQQQYKKIIDDLNQALQQQQHKILQLQNLASQNIGAGYNQKSQSKGNQAILNKFNQAKRGDNKINDKLKIQKNILLQFGQKSIIGSGVIAKSENKTSQHFDKLQQQLDKAQAQNKFLNEKLKKQADTEKALRSQILKLKDNQLLRNNLNITPNARKNSESNNNLSDYNLGNNYYSKKNIRRLSPSPDKANNYRNDRASYEKQDNILASFSEYPNQNYTQLDNTYSQQQTERKTKSAYAINPSIMASDDLWRLLFMQASSLEQFLNTDPQ